MAGRIFLRRTLGLVAIPIVTAFSFSGSPEKVFGDYARDELRYFEEVAFRNDRLYRWRSPIGISTRGSDPVVDPVLEQMIREVQPLLGDLGIRVTENGNLVVHHPATVAAYADRYTQPGPLPLGYAVPWFSGTELTHVDIYIHPLLVPAKRTQVLKHEICHALGLLQHTTTVYSEEGLLGPPSTSRKKQKPGQPLLSRLDRAAIRLLYDSRLRHDLSRKDFRRKTGL
ncbi:MAG TPA: hypothetical protein VGE15_00585 [Sphingobacteriaceae bacterium]